MSGLSDEDLKRAVAEAFARDDVMSLGELIGSIKRRPLWSPAFHLLTHAYLCCHKIRHARLVEYLVQEFCPSDMPQRLVLILKGAHRACLSRLLHEHKLRAHKRATAALSEPPTSNDRPVTVRSVFAEYLTLCRELGLPMRFSTPARDLLHGRHPDSRDISSVACVKAVFGRLLELHEPLVPRTDGAEICVSLRMVRDALKDLYTRGTT